MTLEINSAYLNLLQHSLSYACKQYLVRLSASDSACSSAGYLDCVFYSDHARNPEHAFLNLLFDFNCLDRSNDRNNSLMNPEIDRRECARCARQRTNFRL